MAPVLLGPDIVLLHRGGRRLEVSVVSGVMLVDIGLHRAHAKIAHLLHSPAQEEAKPDPGQALVLRILVRQHVQADPAVRKNGDFVVHPQDRLVGHGRHRLADSDLDRSRNSCSVRSRLRLRAIRAGHRHVLPGHLIRPRRRAVQALQPPQVRPRRVVVGRRAPEVEVGRAVKELLVTDLEGSEQPGECIQPIGKSISFNDQEAVGLLDRRPGL